MEKKEQLIITIREWVRLDNEIRKLQKEQLNRKNEKKNLSTSLLQTMKNNNIDCFDINDGQLVYSKTSVKKPITKKILLELLARYYQGDLLKATDVNDFILNSREDIIKETIVRKLDK